MIGRVIAQYKILAKLGEGGMGQVYKAEDLTLKRRVALKFLTRQSLAIQEIRQRLVREAQAAAVLDHPNICAVFGIHEHEAEIFLAMAYIEGATLAEKIHAGPLPLELALDLAIQIAEGLAEAHDKGVTHRDIKPPNLMVTPKGQIKIMDFGLALLSGRTRLTKTGATFGTPSYMAPEQVNGMKSDHRADIWSFGVVFYEMLTGLRPFDAEYDLGIAYLILNERHKPASALRDGLPAAFDTVIDKALAKDRDARYPDMRALLEDLRRLQSGLAVAAPVNDVTQLQTRSSPAATTNEAPSPRHWSRFAYPAALVALAVALLVGAAAWIISFRHAPSDSIATSKDTGPMRIVVLPFTAAGADPGLAAFGDGLGETLTRRLSQFKRGNLNLMVVPPTEVRSQRVSTPSEAHREFGVAYAIEGAVERQGSTVRLMLTLIDTHQLNQLDTAIVEGEFADAFRLQDKAVASLASLLNLTVEPKHSIDYAKLNPSSPGAYEFYLQGRGYLQRTDQEGSIDNAVQVFQRSIGIDEHYALGHSGLCEAYWFKYLRTKESQWVESALASCGRAMELNDQLAQVRVAMGRVQAGTGNYARSVEEFRRALDLDPLGAEAVSGLANSYLALERFDDAEGTYLQAVRLSPSDWRTYKDLATFYYRRGRYAEAAAEYARVVDLTPDNAQGYSNLGAAQYFAGDNDAAQKNWERSVKIEPRSSALSNLGKLLSDQGDFEGAAARYRQAVELFPNDFRLWGNLGAAYAQLGDQRGAEAHAQALKYALEALAVNPARLELFSYLAKYSLAAGNRAEAERWIDKALRGESSDRAEVIRNADTLEGLGRRDEALAMVRRALEAGASPEAVERSRPLNSLIRDPRYAKLREEFQTLR